MHWSIWHRGRSGVDTARILIGAPGSEAEVATMTTDNTEWKQYTGSYVVPAGQTSTRLSFEAVSTASNNASVGNFIDFFQVSSCGQR